PALRGRRPLPPAPAGPGQAAELLGRERVGSARAGALRAALRPGSVHRVPAARVGIAAAASALLAAALGLGHTHWAPVGAAAALQSPSAGVTARRALQRAVGTLVGVAVAALLVPLATSGPRLLLLTAVCVFAVELCMPRNHALGTVAITALSLLLARVGASGAAVSSLVGDRVGDTLVGVGVGVLVAVLVRNRPASRALAGALAALERSGAGEDPHALRRDLLALRDAHERWIDDSWEAARVPGPRERVERAEELGHRRLGDLLGR
ncbi:FUSC family protein, partial [Kineococcus sp. T13]|uniref:FUSC family protein n=1 Tax=Kineococcus vitellinus TaxID=2696565 RepID=UPI0014130038